MQSDWLLACCKFSYLDTVTAGNSAGESAVIVNLFIFIHLHGRLINEKFISITFIKWKGKSLQVNATEYCEVARVYLVDCSSTL